MGKLINKKVIEINSTNKTYFVIYENKRNKYAKLLVNAKKEIIVRGYNLSIPQINDFVCKNIEWIDKKLNERIEKETKYDTISYYQGEVMYLFGNKYFVKECDEKAYLTYHNVLFVNSGDNIQKIFEEVENTYLYIINEYILKYQKIFKVSPKILFNNMYGKLGYCIVNKNTLVFSKRLIHLSKEVIEYVVVHEFAHLFEANHQKKFYKIIEKHLPDYKDRVKKMKEQNILFKYKSVERNAN